MTTFNPERRIIINKAQSVMLVTWLTDEVWGRVSRRSNFKDAGDVASKWAAKKNIPVMRFDYTGLEQLTCDVIYL